MSNDYIKLFYERMCGVLAYDFYLNEHMAVL